MIKSPTPPNELSATEKEWKILPTPLPPTPPSSAPVSPALGSSSDSQTRTSSIVVKGGPSVARVSVNLVKPVEPPVTWRQVIEFIIWGISVVLGQLWRDVISGMFYNPLLSSDFITHYFVSHLLYRHAASLISPSSSPPVDANPGSSLQRLTTV